MKGLTKIKRIINGYIVSVDTIVAFILTAVCIILCPIWLKTKFCISILEMGIGVLSIVFSIFFAALAFIISASDDDFVSFIEEKGLFTKIVNTFKWTVLSLFVALIYAILIYIVASYSIQYKNKNDETFLHISIIAIYCFLFFYSLIATLLSTNDAIKYSKKRVKFVRKKKDMGKNKHN